MSCQIQCYMCKEGIGHLTAVHETILFYIYTGLH